MATRSTATKTPKTTKAAPKVASKAAPKTPTAAKAVIVEEVKAVVAGEPIKKPELIDRVMAETGLKKKDVKPVVEAMLSVLGKALVKGEELTLPPMGKLMINRSKETANATIVHLKLRHPNTVNVKSATPVED